MFQSNEYKFSNPSIKSSKSNISAIMTIFNQIKIRYEYLLGVVYGCKYECAGIWIFVLQKVIHIPLALLLLILRYEYVEDIIYEYGCSDYGKLFICPFLVDLVYEYVEEI